jgi:hypothetical protein
MIPHSAAAVKWLATAPAPVAKRVATTTSSQVLGTPARTYVPRPNRRHRSEPTRCRMASWLRPQASACCLVMTPCCRLATAAALESGTTLPPNACGEEPQLSTQRRQTSEPGTLDGLPSHPECPAQVSERTDAAERRSCRPKAANSVRVSIRL